MSDASATQEALKRIWNSGGPHELISIMVAYPAARDANIAVQLDEQATTAPPEAAKLLSKMARYVRSVQTLANDFGSVRNLDELVGWYKKDELCFFDGWAELAETIKNDSLQKNQIENSARFENALSVYKEFERLLGIINKFGGQSHSEREKTLNAEIQLCSPTVHHWLRLRGQAEKEEDARSRWYRLSEHLTELCNIIKAKSNFTITKTKTGKAQFSFPASPRDSEAWFLQDPELNAAFKSIIEKVIKGSISFEESITPAVKDGLRKHGSEEVGVPYIISYYLYHLIRCGDPHFISKSSDYFRTLLEMNDATLEDPRIKATLILRYCLIIVTHWRQLNNQVTLLNDAIMQIRFALTLPIEEKSPRLARDLRLNLARLLENLGSWDDNFYEEAATEYRAGLAIARAAHEREAVGRALGGLASVLSSQNDSGRGTIERHEEIVRIYKEALAYLSNDEEHAVNRAVVLNNFAIYYNECELDDWATNQERALILADEAREIVERTTEISTAALLWFSNFKAGVYLTLGNIYRTRYYGEQKKNLDEAIESYTKATRVLVTHKYMKGMLSLNKGQVYLDLFELESEESQLSSASYAFEDAVLTLECEPIYYPIALTERAALILYTETASIEEINNSLADVLRAGELFWQAGDKQKFARTELIAGNILLQKDRTDNGLQEARAHFERAYQIYNSYKIDSDCVNTLRKAATAEIERYFITRRTDALVIANRTLSSAVSHLEKLWSRYQTIEWRRRISLMFSRVYAELVWCRAQLGEEIDELWRLSSLSKAREFFYYGLSQVRQSQFEAAERTAYLEEIRISARKIEAERMVARRTYDKAIAIQEKLDNTKGDLDRLFGAYKLMSSNEDTAASGIQEILSRIQGEDPTTAVIDFTISRWGTVVLLRLPNMENRILSLPFGLAELHGWLNGKGASGWLDTYKDYKTSLSGSDAEWQQARSNWMLKMRELLENLGVSIFHPIFSSFEKDLRDSNLLVVPGLLQGLPLHAALLTSGNSHLYELLKGFAYVPSISLLPSELKKVSPPASALLILADVEKDSQQQLSQSPSEIAETATYLHSLGTKVFILALVGADYGRAVFQARGIYLDNSINIIEEKPTRNSIRTRLAEHEYILYSGHAIDQGLIISDENGEQAIFGVTDILSMPELKNGSLVQLSACETAHEAHGTAAETSSFAPSFLRVGAGSVLGGFWVLNDRVARPFTNAYLKKLYGGQDAPTAYCYALRAARQAAQGLLGNQGEEAIFWAPFALFLGA